MKISSYFWLIAIVLVLIAVCHVNSKKGKGHHHGKSKGKHHHGGEAKCFKKCKKAFIKCAAKVCKNKDDKGCTKLSDCMKPRNKCLYQCCEEFPFPVMKACHDGCQSIKDKKAKKHCMKQCHHMFMKRDLDHDRLMDDINFIDIFVN
ncbi:uncharacterized protein LOC135494844 [Lineus longissimus]|uniref:uncharacterized protein LOC135494844 n=1 Tax=Lineus longissimus TaxID=88925 RepID=UPI00315D4B1A